MSSLVGPMSTRLSLTPCIIGHFRIEEVDKAEVAPRKVVNLEKLLYFGSQDTEIVLPRRWGSTIRS